MATITRRTVIRTRAPIFSSFRRTLPAVACASSEWAIPIGEGQFHRRARGEVLFLQREPLETLEAMRREIGPMAFSAQYQQNPVAPGGNRIRWEHWGSYEERPDLCQLVVQSWDAGLSAEPTSDYSVCTTWGYPR